MSKDRSIEHLNTRSNTIAIDWAAATAHFANQPKRLGAVMALKALNYWPSVREFAGALDWSVGTAQAFLNSVRTFEQKCSNATLSPSSSLSPTPPILTTSPILSDSVSVSSETESPSGAARQPRFEFNHAEEHRADLLRDVIWTHGVRLLTADGSNPESTRSFLGKRIAEIGREPLAHAIVRAIIDQVIEPKAYLGAAQRETVRRQNDRPRDDSGAGEHDVWDPKACIPGFDDDTIPLIDRIDPNGDDNGPH